MKKTFATLALAGLAGAASAQTVTLYGLIDLSAQYLKSGSAAPMAGNSLWRLGDGTIYGPGSRWGIRSTEDLGGGLKAGVLMESGFFADTGGAAQGGRSFGRQIYVWMSAPAGEVRFGRQYMLHDELIGLISPAGGVTVLNPGAVYTLPAGVMPVVIDAPRIDNAMQYLSPVMGGFRVQVMLAPGEGTADRYQGIKGTYSSGPLSLGALWEQSKARVGSPSTVNKLSELAASYDFGVVKAYFGVQQGKNLTTGVGTQSGTFTLPGVTGAATKSVAYSVGLSKKFGNLDVGVAYATSDYENAAGTSRSIGRYGAVGLYPLSKRTSIYGGVALATGDLKNAVNEKTIYQLGLRHGF